MPEILNDVAVDIESYPVVLRGPAKLYIVLGGPYVVKRLSHHMSGVYPNLYTIS